MNDDLDSRMHGFPRCEYAIGDDGGMRCSVDGEKCERDYRGCKKYHNVKSDIRLAEMIADGRI